MAQADDSCRLPPLIQQAKRIDAEQEEALRIGEAARVLLERVHGER
jgi:hypothetical protein